MSKVMGNLIDSRMKASWRMLEDWQSTIYSMMVFGATMVVMFWASVFLYTSFYFTYMPQESITWPIHLQYKSCGEMPGICSFPNSLVSVTDPSRGSLLARGQKYRVVIDLEMPESPTNQKSGTGLSQTLSGMFLITMEMRSFTGDVLRKASRSSMLRYKSPLLQSMSTFIFAPFLLYGAHEEKQLVTAELFSQYEEDPVTPLSDVYIEIGSRNIEVYSAQLRIHATFAGLRHFMYYYPLTAAVFGIGVCMVFLSLIVLFSWYQFSLPAEKMPLGPGGHPNGHLSVEDISKDDYEKDTKEGTDESRRTSSASETSYSPAQMETDTKVEGSGWASLFTRSSSTNNDTKDEETNRSRRTSSNNIATYVSRRKSSPNASRSSSRRSSTRNDDTVQDVARERSSSFFESIVGALSTPESTKDDAQNITLEVPVVSSRRSSAGSTKDDSTSKRSSWIFGGGVSDVNEEKESASNDENTKKGSESRKSSWRSSWFGGDNEIADDDDDKPEIDIQNITLEVPPVSSRRSSAGSTKNDSTSKRSSWIFGGGDSDVNEKKESAAIDENSKKELESRKSSWRSSWFGGDNETADGGDELENEKYTSSKHSSRRSSLCNDETQEELLQPSEDLAGKDTSTSRRSSWRSSWFGSELQDEPAEQLEESNKIGDYNVKDVDEDESTIKDGSLKKSEDERRPSFIESMFGISVNVEQADKSLHDEAAGQLEESDKMGNNTVKDEDEDKSSIEDGSLKKSADERRPSFIESMFGISVNVEQADKSSRRSSTRDDIVDNTLEHDEYYSQQSPVSAPQEDELEVPEYVSRERKPSFVESMMGMLISPKDTSSRRSSTGKEIDNELEVSDSNSRRSSRGSTRDNTRNYSYNGNDDLQLYDTRRSSRRSSRGSTREEALEVPIIKAGSRRSSTGSLGGDTSEVNGRHSPRDVALDDAERLLQDANLVLRRKSSIKDSSIKRVSYLLDEGSRSPRRRSSTSEQTLFPSVDASTHRKSSTGFIKQLLTEPSDSSAVEIQKTSRSPSRDESLRRKSSTTPLSLDPAGEEYTGRHSRSPSFSSDRRLSQSSSLVTQEYKEAHSEDQPRPLSGRLSYLFQESETENLPVTSGVTTERRPSFIESMMGIISGGGGITAQNGSDSKDDEME